MRFPKLENGRRYRVTFTPDPSGPAWHRDPWWQEWTVSDTRGQTAAAFRLYVNRQCRNAKNTAVIEDVTD